MSRAVARPLAFHLVAIALAVVVSLAATQLVAAAPPGVDFSVNPVTPAPGQSATFAAQRLDRNDSVAWDFNNDGVVDATDKTVQHVFPIAGQYTVVMRVTASNGGVTTVTKTVRVEAPPTASFTASPNPATAGNPVEFNASGSSDPDGIVKYEWDLDGNGTYETSTGSTPTASKVYVDLGTVNVKLRVTDTHGATAETTVAVVVDNRRPIASFTASPNPALVGETVTFNAGASSDPGGTIAGYAWDLDNDGQFDDGTGATAARSFAAAGTYTVRLLVTDDRGTTDTASVVVTVGAPAPPNQPPTASFTALPNPVLTGQAVQFSAATSTDSDGTIVSYEWDLDGNGTFETATGSTPTTSRTYLTAGTVSVRLRVTDNRGSTAEKTVAVVVDNRAPVASFTASPNPATVGQSVTFNAGASSDADGTIANYEWDLDNDGQFDDATGVSTGKAFAAAGAYTVRVRVTDDRAATDTATLAVTVNNLPPPPLPNQSPNASFTASPNPVLTGQAVQFSAATSTDPDGTITSYDWDLDGNGSFETTTGGTPTTSKSYAVDGTYNVGLRVTDNGGATAVRTVAVLVQNRAPVASFASSPNPTTVGQSVTFNAGTSSDVDGTIASYEWDLDNDGQFDDATGAVASRSFATTGIHTVRLRVTDNRGAQDTATRTLTVSASPAAPPPNRAPVASFASSPALPRAGDTLYLTSNSSDPDGNIVSHAWDLNSDGRFDDSSSRVVAMPVHVPGFYTVSLRVTDARGAADVQTRTIVVGPTLATALPEAELMRPFPVVRIAGRLTRAGARIKLLVVRGAPRGAEVTVRCRGGGCQRRRQSKQVRAGSVRFRSFERALRAGARIQVFVTQPGRIGKYTSFKIRARRAPLRRDLCVTSTTARPTRCKVS